MHKRFLEGWRAAAHIGVAVQEDFGDSGLEIYVDRQEGSEAYVCRTGEVAVQLARFCNQFPIAELHYHPDSAYGFVAQVRCCCNHEMVRGCCREEGCSRSRILVLLQSEFNPLPEERRKAVFQAADRELLD